jgi:hypothetical protein
VQSLRKLCQLAVRRRAEESKPPDYRCALGLQRPCYLRQSRSGRNTAMQQTPERIVGMSGCIAIPIIAMPINDPQMIPL